MMHIIFKLVMRNVFCLQGLFWPLYGVPKLRGKAQMDGCSNDCTGKSVGMFIERILISDWGERCSSMRWVIDSIKTFLCGKVSTYSATGHWIYPS